MKVSVITPSFNQGHYIEATIRSILSQEFEGDLEYIVVDGGSTDGTVSVLRSFGDRIRWVSEPDNGLADAVNKGLGMATGEIIGWLNSDDLYLPGAIDRAVRHFDASPACRWLYGKCRIIGPDGREIYRNVTRYKNLLLRKFSVDRLLTENYISQPAVFFRRALIEEAGLLRTDLKFAMDYDLWLRFGRICEAGVIPHYLSEFRRHPGSLSETFTGKQFDEQYRVAKTHGASPLQLAIHRFNNVKIVLGYKALSLFSR